MEAGVVGGKKNGSIRSGNGDTLCGELASEWQDCGLIVQTEQKGCELHR